MLESSDGLEGRIVGGDFKVVRLLATGGMAAVYEATQTSTGRARAIKVMHGWLLRDPAMRARFVDEARVASSIESDHVVEVVSAGIDDALGAPWIAMELLRGQTLADYVEQKGRLSQAECLEMLMQVRHGLALAHGRGLVHRDLKPDNLFVASARRPGVPFTIKILDFGIAKWLGEVREGMKNSQAMGTPSWMAPEQLMLGKSITPATDVWALGLLAFWMLSGKEYWLAANQETGSVAPLLVELVTTTQPEAASARSARVGGMSELPAGFDAWFARCVHPVAERRFSDAERCIDALAELLAPGPHAPVAGDAATMLNPADDDAAWWAGHATAHVTEHRGDAALEGWLSSRSKPRPTAWPIGADALLGRLWAGPSEHAALTALFELLMGPLAPASAEPGPISGTAPPYQVQDAVDHAAAILSITDPITVVVAEEDDTSFRCVPGMPGVLLAPHSFCELSSLALRAHAAVALACAAPVLDFACSLGSPEALDQARRAAHALARGTIVQGRDFRRLATALGLRRAELGRVIDAAEGVTTAEWWTAAELTVARAALLVSADLPSTLDAVTVLAPRTPRTQLDKSLYDFVHDPSFESLWYQPARGA